MSESMKLSAFVSSVLSEIAEGVANAAPLVKQLGGSVNPNRYEYSPGVSTPERLVEFDIAVFVESSSGTDTGGRISVAGFIDASKDGKTVSQRNQHESRIKFQIPMKLPAGHNPDVHRDPAEIGRSYVRHD